MVNWKNRGGLLFLFAGIFLEVITWYLSHHNNGSWYVNIAAYAIPLYLVLILLILVVILVKKYWIYAVVLGCVACLLLKPIRETTSFGYFKSVEPSVGDSVLHVLSFNTSTFNRNRNEPFQDDDSVFLDNFFGYLNASKDQWDIICFQEFHHHDGDDQRIADEIVKYTHTPYYYTVPLWQSVQSGFFGIMTMSKYPIIKSGTLFEGEMNTINRGIYTDILYAGDTIRVINIHLHSMNIRFNHIDSIGVINKFKGVLDSLKSGSIKSKEQIEQVLSAIKQSKYPVILCGDFNTFPYGYSYQQVKKYLNNSFEKAGKGFGFTLNLFPYVVRIDNQFVSDEFVPLESEVVKDIKHSDHFMLVGKYLYKNQSTLSR